MVADKHDGEPTVEVDHDIYVNWLEAKDAAGKWKKLEAHYRDLLEKQIGDRFAATVNGEKVITYRPANNYAEAQLLKDYPELTQHYVHVVTRQDSVFDMDLFARAHPEVAERYRVRPFRAAE